MTYLSSQIGAQRNKPLNPIISNQPKNNGQQFDAVKFQGAENTQPSNFLNTMQQLDEASNNPADTQWGLDLLLTKPEQKQEMEKSLRTVSQLLSQGLDGNVDAVNKLNKFSDIPKRGLSSDNQTNIMNVATAAMKTVMEHLERYPKLMKTFIEKSIENDSLRTDSQKSEMVLNKLSDMIYSNPP